MIDEQWRNFSEVYPTIAICGDIRIWQDFYSPQLDNKRDILVWLPPDYATSERRYPVIYVHDAQNIFANELSFVGEWGFDETMTALASEGISAIIVGVNNMGEARRVEYSPFDWEYGKGLGDAYLAFLTDTLKPLIDTHFRTQTHPSHNGLLGSSMGGLISLYGIAISDVFGFGGVFSPYFAPDNGAIHRVVEQRLSPNKRIYMDVGTREADNLNVPPEEKDVASQRYLESVRQMDRLLRQKGYDDHHYLYVEDEGGIHHEIAWARRLPNAIRFLLSELSY